MVAVPICPMLEMAVVGSPGYFERRGIPETPADLIRHDCIGYRQTWREASGTATALRCPSQGVR